MRIINCDKGHFYDADMFPECPHCQGEINKDIPLQSTSIMRKKIKVQNGVEQPAQVQVVEEQSAQPQPVQTQQFKPQSVQPHVAVEQSVQPQVVQPQQVQEIPTPAKNVMATPSNKSENKKDGVKKLVVGWLVCIDGDNRGDVSTIYNESNMIYGLNIVFNEELSRLYLNLVFSEVTPDLNNRRISDSEYIYDQDKLRIGNNTYMVVELCRDGFSWKKKQKDERSNSAILRSMWKCNVCGAMNGEYDGYCLVCGAEK